MFQHGKQRYVRHPVGSATTIVVLLSALLVPLSPAAAGAATPVECRELRDMGFDGLNVTSVSAVIDSSGTYRPRADTRPSPPPPLVTGLPEFCDVVLTLNSPGTANRITVEVWLPARGWNGRFQALGGSGFVGGLTGNGLVSALNAGYAAASTDTGHQGSDGSFALDATGRLDWPAIEDFGHRAVHQMTVAAKAVIARYYGKMPRYSYWNGCSTGGRQGLMEAQRYPDDYDGILANAPAVNWTRFLPGSFWAQVVMRQNGTFRGNVSSTRSRRR